MLYRTFPLHNTFCLLCTRVEIIISYNNKHRLPVESGCRYQHSDTISLEDEGCLSVNGTPVENYYGIERCVEEADCTIEGGLSHVSETGTPVR